MKKIEMKKDCYGMDDIDGYAQELIASCIDQMFDVIDSTKKTDETKKRIKKIFLEDMVFHANRHLNEGEKEFESKCSYCKRDIIQHPNIDVFYLKLRSARLPPSSNCVYDILIQDPIESIHNFCGIGCIHRWAKEQDV